MAVNRKTSPAKGTQSRKSSKVSRFTQSLRDCLALRFSCGAGPDLPAKETRDEIHRRVAARLGRKVVYSDRAFQNWWRGPGVPDHKDICDALLVVALGDDAASEPRRDALTEQWKDARSARRAGPRAPVGLKRSDNGWSDALRTRPIAKPKHKLLAYFTVDTGGQGNSPDEMLLYLSYLAGRLPVTDGIGWVAAKRVDLQLTAEDYTELDHLNEDGVKAKAGVWEVTPRGDQPFLDGSLFDGRRDKPVFVKLVRNDGEDSPKPPEIKASIPGVEFLHAECAGEAADAPRSAGAVIEAFLKVCTVGRAGDIDLGSATFKWEE